MGVDYTNIHLFALSMSVDSINIYLFTLSSDVDSINIPLFAALIVALEISDGSQVAVFPLSVYIYIYPCFYLLCCQWHG